jgi:hypothetical protein
LLVTNSIITKSTTGVTVGTNNIASIFDSFSDGNTTALAVNGAGAVAGVVRSFLNGTTNAITTSGGGQAISFGPSNVLSGAGGFSAPATPFQ